MLAIITDSKPAISAPRKLDKRNSARESAKVTTGSTADRLMISKEAPILGHEAEGVVTPAGLRAT